MSTVSESRFNPMPHGPHWMPALDAWATGAWCTREIELLYGDGEREASKVGRLDALMITIEPWNTPWARKIQGWSWDASRIVGAEVKLYRSDFLRGLREGQFERYDAAVSGLYLLAPQGVARTKELPAGVGHLVLVVDRNRKGYRLVCRRHPRFTDTLTDSRMLVKLLATLHKEHREERRRWLQYVTNVYKRTGERFGAALQAIESAPAPDGEELAPGGGR